MKIKHWQGYGSVNATCVAKEMVSALADVRIIHIKVKGNHEWGLIRDDVYDVKRWLLDKFDKSAKDLNPYHDVRVKVELQPSENGEEVAMYHIAYGKDLRNIM